MRRFVNGEEVDLESDPSVISLLPDRLAVRTAHGSHTAVAVRNGDTVQVSFLGHVFTIEKTQGARSAHVHASTGEIRAPMPGQIVDVFVAEGQAVSNGDKLLVLEAMKTHQSLTAPFAGKVAQLPFGKGAQVAEGDLLAHIEPSTESV